LGRKREDRESSSAKADKCFAGLQPYYALLGDDYETLVSCVAIGCLVLAWCSGAALLFGAGVEWELAKD